MAGWGGAHTLPVINLSPRLCKEAQSLLGSPQVNFGSITPEFVAGTLGRGIDTIFFLPWEEIKLLTAVIKYLRIQEKGVLLGFISQSDVDWLIPVYLKQS